MRFYAFEKDMKVEDPPFKNDVMVDDSISVRQLKKHFFDALKNIGELIPINEKLTNDEARTLFARPDAIFAQMHFDARLPGWDGIPKRRLRHSLGSFLLPDYFMNSTAYHPNTMNLVTTDHQAGCLERNLRQAGPPLAVFTPRLDEARFYPPDDGQKAAARRDHGLEKDELHLVYAGRWLATKGICQLLRVLALWPNRNVKVSLVGNFSPAFDIRISNTSHFTFEAFIRRESVAHSRNLRLSFLPGRTADDLRQLYWSTDLFIYPSGHEDENFGFSPREAALCGVPSVVTDYCGLHHVGVLMPWGGIGTYPSFAGVRYSLRQFRRHLDQGLAKKDWDPLLCAGMIKKECDTVISEGRLKETARILLSVPLEEPGEPEAALKQLKTKLLRYADEKIAAAFIDKKSDFTDGAYVDGSGIKNDRHKLIQAIQGIYTTAHEAPKVAAGARLRGFFRVALWNDERAIVEFGFPGPRFKRYESGNWRELTASLIQDETDDLVFCPRNGDQIRLSQELVELGYLVPDE
jgi:hypothetical protein